MFGALRYRLYLLKLGLQCYEYCAVVAADRWSVQRRHALGRMLQAIGAGIFILWIALMMTPASAFADIVGDLQSILGGGFNVDPANFKGELQNAIDPTSTVRTQTGRWYNQAQQYATDMYGILLVIEIFLFGVQAVLFRDSIQKILASFTFKVFTIGFFIWLIGNAQNEFQMVIDSFSQTGQKLMNDGASMPHAATPGGSVAQFAVGGLALAAAYYALGIYGQQRDKSQAEQCGNDFADPQGTIDGKVQGDVQGDIPIVAEFSGITVYAGGLDGVVRGKVGGTDDVTLNVSKDWGCATSVPFTHLLFDVACFGMGMMVAGSVAVVLLTWAMITIESYMVMGAGVFFLGFAGMRHTVSFSQGYLSYAVNVGIKMFTFWIILAIENTLMFKLLEDAALVLLGSFALTFDGGTWVSQIVKFSAAGLALAAAGLAVFTCMIISALAYAIPNFAGSFITGSTALSSMHMLTGTISSLAASARVASSARRILMSREFAKEGIYKEQLQNLSEKSSAAPVIESVNAPDRRSSSLSGSSLPSISSSGGGDSTAARVTADGGGTAPRGDIGWEDGGSVPVRRTDASAAPDGGSSPQRDALKKSLAKRLRELHQAKENIQDGDDLHGILTWGGKAVKGSGQEREVEPVKWGDSGMGGA